MTNLIICRSRNFPLRQIGNCPNCNRRRRLAVEDGGWYGRTWTCCACGDRYSPEEGRMPRPFKRGWREESRAHARQVWEDAGRYTKADYKRWIFDLMDMGEQVAA